MFKRPRIEDVAPREVDALCEQGALLLDVREDDEWAAGHAPGAVHMPLAGVTDATAQFAGRQVLADLISAEATEGLTRAQFQSVRRLAGELPSQVDVHPTHGFGSFCSSASSSGSDASTIGQEQQSNLALTLDDEDVFVERLLSGLTAYPSYYVQMAPINQAGPGPIDLSPPEPVDPVEIRRRVHDGEWVVDLRSRTAFARGHLAGTVNLEVGDSFATFLGWTLRWGTPVTLVGDTAAQVAEAQRQMVRIGIDRPAGSADGGVDTWAAGGELRSYRTATFADLADIRDGVVVLDVRRDDEWIDGGIADAVHIPLHDLEARLAEVPDGTVWVHCASGYRASIAASLLDRAGRTVVAIDDDWESAAKHAPLGVAREG